MRRLAAIWSTLAVIVFLYVGPVLLSTLGMESEAQPRTVGTGGADDAPSPSPRTADPNPTADSAASPGVRVYEVRKKVADFPDREDLSTPEAAYASIHRAYTREGTAAFPRLSVPRIVIRMSGSERKTV